MISVRQHVTSLVAVFLALAVGLALGGGLLGGTEDRAGDASGTAPSSTGPATRTGRGSEAYADAFAAVGAGRLYANGLDTHATAIVAMPGADDEQVKALQGQIAAAGGAVTGTYTIGDDLVDPANRDTIESVGSDLATQLADPRVDPAATSYDRMGILLALAVATTQPSSVRADLAAVTIREALASQRLLTSPNDVRNAPLVLLVLPPGDDDGGDSLATRTSCPAWSTAWPATSPASWWSGTTPPPRRASWPPCATARSWGPCPPSTGSRPRSVRSPPCSP